MNLERRSPGLLRKTAAVGARELTGTGPSFRGVFGLSEAVRMLTSKQARILGPDDRGSLEVGKRAGIKVIDIERVAERQPQRVTDFPGDAARLVQRAAGYRNTVVNGVVVLEEDELTGARGGTVLR